MEGYGRERGRGREGELKEKNVKIWAGAAMMMNIHFRKKRNYFLDR